MFDSQVRLCVNPQNNLKPVVRHSVRFTSWERAIHPSQTILHNHAPDTRSVMTPIITVFLRGYIVYPCF